MLLEKQLKEEKAAKTKLRNSKENWEHIGCKLVLS
jgi:hypothetical protein